MANPGMNLKSLTKILFLNLATLQCDWSDAPASKLFLNDARVWSVIGRKFTIATNQVDSAVPSRFGLTYCDKDILADIQDRRG